VASEYNPQKVGSPKINENNLAVKNPKLKEKIGCNHPFFSTYWQPGD
jgi:hypothetical protein